MIDQRSRKLYAGGFDPLRSRGYRRAMGKSIATKIRNLRLVLGLTQGELADLLKVTQASVSRWENGSMPETDKLAKLAEIAGETIESFIDDTGLEAPMSELLNRYWVRGVVAANVWAAAYEWQQSEWTPYSGGTHIEAEEGSRYGLKVEGDSMNQVYPSGTVLDCIRLEAFTGELTTGQRVIVERKRGGDVEATVKEYVVADDGGKWLVPRSHNPAFQAPISASEPGEGVDEIKVVAVVVGSYRPEYSNR